MRRARAVVVLRYALAAALAAIAVPLIAHAAFGDDALATPTAQVFPTRTGIGVTWNPVDASTYRVERKQADSEWQDASGDLTSATTTWIDESLAAGTSADYRVIAQTSDTESVTSATVTATRAAQAPVIGDVDVLTVDARAGNAVTWLKDEVAGPVATSAPANGSRILSAGTLELKMPAVLAGPGEFDLAPGAYELKQGDRSCALTGRLKVVALAYTPDLELETMTASLTASTCAGTQEGFAGEIRFKSANNYAALSVEPSVVTAGQITVQKTSANLPITVKNTGTKPVEIGRVQLGAGYPQDWFLRSNNCPATLPVGGSCAMTVTFEPWHTGASKASLVFDDSTATGWHAVTLSGTGVSLPGLSNPSVRATFTGHVISWPYLATAAGASVRGYFLHRYVDGAETTQWLYPAETIVVDPKPKPGVKYALSVVNEVGEGPTGSPTAPPSVADQLAVVADNGATTRQLMGADVGGAVVPFPADSTTAQEVAVTSSPDGRSLAYVSVEGSHTLNVRRVSPGEFGASVELWSSPTPITHLAWSPDGTRIAFETRETGDDTARRCVFVIPASGGTPEKVDCGLGSPSWVPTDLSLVVIDERTSDGSHLARIAARPGGPVLQRYDVQATPGSPIRVSPEGPFVALGSGDRVQRIELASGFATSSQLLGDRVTALSFDPDGRRLLVLTAANRLATLDPYRLADATPVNIWNGRHTFDVAWQGLNLVIGPIPAVMGSDASVSFDPSALSSDAVVTCRFDGRLVSPCASPARLPGDHLYSGTHTVVIEATEPTGRHVLARRSFTVDVSGPVSQVVSPTFESTTAGSASVKYSASDSTGVASYDVRYRKASYLSGFGAYVQPWTGTTTTSVNLALEPGYEYCTSVRAKDKLGNLGAWSAEKCFARAMDDRALAAPTAGWSRTSWSAFYLGTATQSTSYGASLSRTVQGKRFALVATKCPTCGLVAVYAGGKYIGAVNLASATTQRQAVIPLPTQSSLFSGTLTFTVRSATGKFVQIDGLAVRKS